MADIAQRETIDADDVFGSGFFLNAAVLDFGDATVEVDVLTELRRKLPRALPAISPTEGRRRAQALTAARSLAETPPSTCARPAHPSANSTTTPGR